MDQEESESSSTQKASSKNPEAGSVVVQIGENEIAVSNSKTNEPVLDKGEEESTKVDSASCVMDVKEFMGDNNQRVCRICHLSAKESGQSSMELVQLGCGCKGELGVAHVECAEAWFRVKGNRMCEICGQTANNITGVRDTGFLDEWNESRPTELGAHSPDAQRTCLGRQPLCNFLMACLVVAFVLPWFFRVNMF